MVVAAKRRKQTNQRTFDFSGMEVVKPESGRLAVFMDIKAKLLLVWPLFASGPVDPED